MKATWYLQRLSRMEPSELAGRVHDQLLHLVWRFNAPDLSKLVQRGVISTQVHCKLLPEPSTISSDAATRLIACADEILLGHWEVFARHHPCFGSQPDWFVDARSGSRAPADVYSFVLPYRDEAAIGNIKYIWEPSRHHHLTILAAAYHLTSDDRYAERIAEHLTSWWRENPFLHGPHWISGIELAIRLIAWSWVRQLLGAWPGVHALFEHNERFIQQLYGHQLWLSRFPSRGSSANNHLVAEAAGQFVAACVFPFFRESAKWKREAATTLRDQAIGQTFESGVNRELATDYHGFVLELLLAAAVQGDATDSAVPNEVWETICRMADVIAAMLDDSGRPPRQGDSDEGTAALFDDPTGNRWHGLLATCAGLFPSLAWWPRVSEPDVRTALLTAGLSRRQMSGERPARRPGSLEDAGQTYLRSGTDKVWCRVDHGPHGLGRIAAHAHADALSLELRIGGTEILADPGTFCYHGDPRWRSYFRSTFAHNTLQLMERDQSVSGGPFLWTRHATTRLISVDGLADEADEASIIAEHFGYGDVAGQVHRRCVALFRKTRRLIVTDHLIECRRKHPDHVKVSLSWHLGPDVECDLQGCVARLSWPSGTARLALPPELGWTIYRGDETVPAGWYSPSFDRKIAASTLVGSGVVGRTASFHTELEYEPEPV